MGTSLAARYTGDCEQTIRRRADAGDIPCERDAAGRRMFYAEDLDAFIQTKQCA